MINRSLTVLFIQYYLFLLFIDICRENNISTIYLEERCPSGRRSATRNRVSNNIVPWVQIPPSPLCFGGTKTDKFSLLFLIVPSAHKLFLIKETKKFLFCVSLIKRKRAETHQLNYLARAPLACSSLANQPSGFSSK